MFTLLVLCLKSNPIGVTRVNTDNSNAGYGDHKLNKAKMIARKK